MKKLFSLIAVMALALSLSACSTDDLEKQISDLEAQIATLQTEGTADETTIANLQAQIADLQTAALVDQAQIEYLEDLVAELQDTLFDNIVKLTLTDVDGESHDYAVGYDDDFTGTMFDLLVANFDVEYSTSTYGNMLLAINGVKPLNGAYISISKNGEASMVGIDAITFADGDKFTFEVLWYNTTEEAVYNSLKLFLENKVEDYTSATNMDYNVVAGLAQLGILEDYVTQTEVDTYIATLDPANAFNPVSAYFKIIMLVEATGGDATTYYQALNNVAATGPYGQTAYALLGLDAASHTNDYSGYLTNALAYFTNTATTPTALDLDAGGISLVALAKYKDETGIQAIIDEFSTHVSTNQLASGGIMTQDFGWGSSENASSISQTILGLISCSVDPTGTDFTKGTNNLVSRLVEFQVANGLFDWVLTDETADDPAFSTPQAFLALATYQTYSNHNEAINPFDFN